MFAPYGKGSDPTTVAPVGLLDLVSANAPFTAAYVIDKCSCCCLFLNTRRLLTSSKLSVPVCFVLYAKASPSYLALKVCGAGGGFGTVTLAPALSSAVRGI